MKSIRRHPHALAVPAPGYRTPRRLRGSVRFPLAKAGAAILAVAGLSALATPLRAQPQPAAAEPAIDLAGFLAERGIDLAGRADLAEASAWDVPQLRTAIRVLLRLEAPTALWRRWLREAGPYDPQAAPAILDALVSVEGRAVFVAPVQLGAEEAALAGRESLDLVRIVPGAEGSAAAPVDVLVRRAPRAWPRWRPIAEPAAVSGLPLTTGVSPHPAPPPADGSAWPDSPPALLLGAVGVGYRPDTPLGRLGMDYALFDTIRDGGKLGAGDADAFYAVLAAVGGQRTDAPSPPTDIVPIIDPGQRWFAEHRGDPVTVAGVARRATRIAVDDPARRAEVGADHYWEVFVFVSTPPLLVDGREQDTYPVVCVVRELPAGMPAGDQIAEEVIVQGFALKRYGYPLADIAVTSSQGDEEAVGRRRETLLVVGARATWRPAPRPAVVSGWLSWVFLGIVGGVAALLAFGAWSRRRDHIQRQARLRQALPERVDLPPSAG